MKKKIVMAIMVFAMGAVAVPSGTVSAHCWCHDHGWYANDNDYYDDDDDWYYANDGWYYGDDDWYDDDDDYDEDDWYDEELTVYDLFVNPTKKEILAGNTFYIDLIPSDDSGWEELSEEEWEEICEDNIESIEYHSMKSSIASVNKFTGKVKAKKKGSTIIKTRVHLMNDESIIFKTRVVVTR